MIFAPANGTRSSQSGGGPSLKPRSDLAQLAISSALATIVPIAAENGATKTSSSATIIAVTASQRLPQSRACAATISGQVDTTIIVAQMVAARNGRRIQNVAKIIPPRNSTARTMRARSSRGGVMARAGGTCGCYPPGAVRENGRGGRAFFSQ